MDDQKFPEYTHVSNKVILTHLLSFGKLAMIYDGFKLFEIKNTYIHLILGMLMEWKTSNTIHYIF